MYSPITNKKHLHSQITTIERSIRPGKMTTVDRLKNDIDDIIGVIGMKTKDNI